MGGKEAACNVWFSYEPVIGGEAKLNCWWMFFHEWKEADDRSPEQFTRDINAFSDFHFATSFAVRHICKKCGAVKYR